MNRLNDFSILTNAISKVKKLGKLYFTNFYMSKRDVDKLIGSKNIYYHINNKAVLVFIEENEFFRLYFSTCSINFMGEFEYLFSKMHKPIVLDIISKNKKKNLDFFYNSGFVLHKIFRRMISTNCLEYKTSIESEFAKPEDKDNIEMALMEEFDIFAEHLPQRNQLEDKLRNNSILIKKEDDDLAALLMFNTIGISSTLNYWYVNKKYRGQGLGSKVFKSYMKENQECKRFILWVDDNNKNTIEKYKRYGYDFDGLIDYILIRNNG